MHEQVILVDEDDIEIGCAEKLEAHQVGALHRACSVFIFNEEGRLLLQKRAITKYHCGGLWSNSCCGHPRPGESVENAAKRRLKEEMGLNCPLTFLFKTLYLLQLSNNLIEHEYDHVFVGVTDKKPEPNSREAMDHKWIYPLSLQTTVETNPNEYTPWFRLLLPRVIEEYAHMRTKKA